MLVLFLGCLAIFPVTLRSRLGRWPALAAYGQNIQPISGSHSKRLPKALRTQVFYDEPATCDSINWARLLAFVTGLVNQELLLQNEYLAAENRILRAQLPKRLRLTDPQRSTLAEIGKRLGRKALEQVACVAKPDTILGWYRRLIARKFDGSRQRLYPGRPPVQREIVELVVRMARENSGW